MTRGDIVIVRQSGTAASKARPCLIVQNSATLSFVQRVTACPLTSTLRGTDLFRLPIGPSAENGLTRPSEIEIDLIGTFGIAHVAGVVGRAEPSVLRRVDDALRRWLSL